MILTQYRHFSRSRWTRLGGAVSRRRAALGLLVVLGCLLVAGPVNWNEFGEGHYLMPTRGFGFGHLDAVRGVFAPQAPPHTDIAPLDHGFGPYDSRFRSANGINPHPGRNP
jgi:hypothetical protein